MASSDAGAAPQLAATVAVPRVAGPVRVVAAPGLPEADFRKALDSALFRRWLENLQTEKGVLAYGKLSLRQVLIQGVDMFGQRVGFLRFKANIVDEETQAKIPGIVFARGPAVAVLILLESKGQTYAVLTEQARVPIGKFILELPAGMLDDENGDFVGTAVREVKVETGIKLNLEDMVDLTALLDPSTGCRMLPSPGARGRGDHQGSPREGNGPVGPLRADQAVCGPLRPALALDVKREGALGHSSVRDGQEGRSPATVAAI